MRLLRIAAGVKGGERERRRKRRRRRRAISPAGYVAAGAEDVYLYGKKCVQARGEG